MAPLCRYSAFMAIHSSLISRKVTILDKSLTMSNWIFEESLRIVSFSTSLFLWSEHRAFSIIVPFSSHFSLKNMWDLITLAFFRTFYSGISWNAPFHASYSSAATAFCTIHSDADSILLIATVPLPISLRNCPNNSHSFLFSISFFTIDPLTLLIPMSELAFGNNSAACILGSYPMVSVGTEPRNRSGCLSSTILFIRCFVLDCCVAIIGYICRLSFRHSNCVGRSLLGRWFEGQQLLVLSVGLACASTSLTMVNLSHYASMNKALFR